MKYKEWLDEWLENYVRPSAKGKTYGRYREIANQHVKRLLGEREVEEITPVVIQRAITQLSERGNLKTGKGLSPNSVNSIVTVIQGSLKLAQLAGVTAHYTADRVRRPKMTEKPVSCFSRAEQKRIEQAVLESGKPKLFGIVLCLYTGLRIGELLALEWTDVDFEKGEITVSKSCYDGKNGEGKFCRITDCPKTSASVRVIPLPRQLIPALRNLKKKSGGRYVVDGGKKTVPVRSYQKTFARILQNLGIAHKGFHALRHTFATRAIEYGMDVKTLSELLGHKSPGVTLNRYVHSLMEHKREMMNRLGKNL
ncbi:MAG: tyrosine-type recombinase/integrase [Candidatus Gallimonas sp.]